eukprot:12274148-Karenia_brevis.AAC.1
MESDAQGSDNKNVLDHGANHTSLTILYLFAGAKRKSDVGDFMEQLAKEKGIMLHLHEIDLLIGGDCHDLSKEDVWQQVLTLLPSVDGVLATPPCHTHSRATWSN